MQKFHRAICWLLGHRWVYLGTFPIGDGKAVAVTGCGRGVCGQRGETVLDVADLVKRLGHPANNYMSN